MKAMYGHMARYWFVELCMPYVLHHFGIAHGFVNARNGSHQFAQDTLSNFQYVRLAFEIFGR